MDTVQVNSGIAGARPLAEGTERIIAVLRSIPAGRVTSYGAVAASAGLPRGARQVARILHSLSRSLHLPWHRVLRSDGSIALPEGSGRELQAALLRAEGVELAGGRSVDLERFGHRF